MLYLIGLGLAWGDLSMKALEAINQSDEVYLEGYTSVSDWSVDRLKRLIGKNIVILDRKQTEEVMPYLKEAHVKDVALLVYGDPLSATTHVEILLQAKKKKIKTKIIHSNSVLTAVSETGLSIYKFGKTASIPLPEKGFAPSSFYDALKENQSIDAHTLFLLDLKPPKTFMTIPQAIKTLLDIAKKRNPSRTSSTGPSKTKVLLGEQIFTERTFCIGCARLGTETQKIKAGTAKILARENWGNPPYCLIVPAKLNFKEEEFIKKLK